MGDLLRRVNEEVAASFNWGVEERSSEIHWFLEVPFHLAALASVDSRSWGVLSPLPEHGRGKGTCSGSGSCSVRRSQVDSQRTDGAIRTVVALPEPAVALGSVMRLLEPLAGALHRRLPRKKQARSPICPKASRPGSARPIIGQQLTNFIVRPGAHLNSTALQYQASLFGADAAKHDTKPRVVGLCLARET